MKCENCKHFTVVSDFNGKPMQIGECALENGISQGNFKWVVFDYKCEEYEERQNE